jgi:hypothetical protein
MSTNGNEKTAEKVSVHKQRLEYLEGIEKDHGAQLERDYKIVALHLQPGTRLQFGEESNYCGLYQVIGDGTRANGEPFVMLAVQCDDNSWNMADIDVADLENEWVYNTVKVVM